PPGVAPVPAPPEPPPTSGPSRQSFGEWYRHKPIAWVGTGLAGLGLIGGIVFSAQAKSASNAANGDVAQINQNNANFPSQNPNHVSNLCTDPAALKAAYAQPCSILQANISNYNTDTKLAG